MEVVRRGCVGERGFGRWPCFLWGVGISVAEALQEWRQNQSWAVLLQPFIHPSHQDLVLTLAGAWGFSLGLGN